MKVILNIISRIKVLLAKRFRRAKAEQAVNEHEELRKAVVKAEEAIYKNIKIQLENDPDIAKYGADARLLHRRLAQYERMRNHASLSDQVMALRKLEKQWRKVEHSSDRKNHKENSCIQRALETGHPGRIAGLS